MKPATTVKARQHGEHRGGRGESPIVQVGSLRSA
jgi:hypothetical protein